MRRRAMPIGALLLVVAGTGAIAQEGEAHQPARPCVRIDVRAAGGKAGSAVADKAATAAEDVGAPALGGRALPKKRTFSATAVRDLEFVVSYDPRQPVAAVDLAVRTPRGHLYQRMPVTNEATDTKAPARLLGTARLPLSGTLIVNSSLYGEWTVEPRLPRSPTSCAPPERFTIEP